MNRGMSAGTGSSSRGPIRRAPLVPRGFFENPLRVDAALFVGVVGRGAAIGSCTARRPMQRAVRHRNERHPMKITHADTFSTGREVASRVLPNQSHRTARRGVRASGAALFALAACTGLALAVGSDELKPWRPPSDTRAASSNLAPATKDPALRVRSREAMASLPGAQSTSSTSKLAPLARAVDHDRVYFRDSSDALWSRGTAYKSEFRSGRATFVPCFGAQSASHPISFHLDLVAVGDHAIAFSDASSGAAFERDGARISMKRGALVEQYDVSPASMEQRFVFNSLPGCGDLRGGELRGGDLTLRIGFDADLAASSWEVRHRVHRRARSRALQLRDRARRARQPLSGGDRARRQRDRDHRARELPRRRDVPADDRSGDRHDPGDRRRLGQNSCADVAYDASTNRYFVVYQEWYSQNDNDAYAAEFDANGNQIYIESLDMSFDDWTNMKTANNAIADQFLVVADVNSGGHHTQGHRGVGRRLLGRADADHRGLLWRFVPAPGRRRRSVVLGSDVLLRDLGARRRGE